MVDKFFKSMFSAVDQTMKLDPLALVGVKQAEETKITTSKQMLNLDKTILSHSDRTLCILHKQKKEFFCDECTLELCIQCRDKHPKGHTIRFQEETSNMITQKFHEGKQQVKELRGKLNYAAKRDPTEIKSEESVNALDHGNKLIDEIYDKIFKAIHNSKAEMKERFKESYKANYRSTIQKKSQGFLTQLDKLNNYVELTLQDFEKLQAKGRHAKVCVQRQKTEDLTKNLKKFDDALSRMVQRALEFRSDYQIYFQQANFDEELKTLLNRHINVTFPGLEEGVFQVRQNTNKHVELSFYSEQPGYAQPFPVKRQYSPSSNSESSDFPNFEAHYNNNQQNSNSSNMSMSLTLDQSKSQVQSDSRFELKTLRFMKDRFMVKLYDTQNGKSSQMEISVPPDCKHIATKHFSYVSLGQYLLMCGGQYVEDKTCSQNTYKININKQTMKCTGAEMIQGRIHHSLINIEEKNFVLAVGGEDMYANQLDSCEQYNVHDNTWKQLNVLNNKMKNPGLCKFIVESKKGFQFYVYAFGKFSIERLDLNQYPVQPRWEEVDIVIRDPLPFYSNLFQFDDHLIVISGGVHEQSTTKDVIFFNPIVNKLEKQPKIQLTMVDKFLGANMTQSIINRLDQKIYFCSDAFVHIASYAQDVGEAKFKMSSVMY